MSNAAEAITDTETPPEQFALVEIFGHRQHAGRILEVEQFGAKMLRIDVPKEGDFEKGYVSHFYGGASIFSLTLADKATVEAKNRPWRPAALPYREPADDHDDDHGAEDDEGDDIGMGDDPGMA